MSNHLNKIKIASPCQMNWNDMLREADENGRSDRTRFCQTCSKNVYNISAMAKEEAEQFLTEVQGKVCVRLYRRRDGTIITDDCPVGLKRIRYQLRRLSAICGGLIASVLATAPALAQLKEAHESVCPKPPGDAVVYMGEVVTRTVPGAKMEEITEKLKSSKSRHKNKMLPKAIARAKNEYQKGVVYESYGKIDEAIESYRKALNEPGSDPVTYTLLGKLLIKRDDPGDREEAAELFEKRSKILKQAGQKKR